jgi:uncharacterized protein YqgC (DUF456 family)
VNEPLQILLLWVVQFLMLIGLFGLLFPVFPGLWVMWGAALLYGLVHGFDTTGWIVMVLITLLALGASLADNLLMGLGARQGGASWKTIAVALAGGVLGTIFFPPLGGIIVAPLAIYVLEYYRLRDARLAWQALVGLMTGWGLGALVRFAAGLLINGLWWLWVWVG